MTEAGTSHWMNHGFTAYWRSTIPMAKATGNHSGAPRNATTANPTASSKASSPPIEGSERRITNDMPPGYGRSARLEARQLLVPCPVRVQAALEQDDVLHEPARRHRPAAQRPQVHTRTAAVAHPRQREVTGEGPVLG